MNETIREVIIGGTRDGQRFYAHDNDLSRPLFCSSAFALRGMSLKGCRVHVLEDLNDALLTELALVRSAGDAVEYRRARRDVGGWEVEVFTESGVEELRVKSKTAPVKSLNFWLRDEHWYRVCGRA